MDLYRRVRLACHVEGLNQREASRRFGVSRDSISKMLQYSEPTGYQRSASIKRPKLDGFTDIIDSILEGDRQVGRKQRQPRRFR